MAQQGDLSGGTALGAILIYAGASLAGVPIGWYAAILSAVVLSSAAVAVYAYRYKIRNTLTFVLLFFGSLVYPHDRLRVP